MFFVDDLLSSINGEAWTFYFSCMSVPTTAKLLNFWTFGKILSHLRKNIRGHMHSPWRSECSWRGHLRAPQNGQNRALVKKRELNLGNICRHIFVHVYFRAISQNMKIKLSPAPELNFCGPVPLKKAFHRLALSFVILWILPHPNRICGGTCGPKRCAQHLIGV